MPDETPDTPVTSDAPVTPDVPADLDAAIAEAALAPKSATVDGQTVQAHDLSDLIEADRYLASKKTAKSRRGAFGALHATQMAHSGSR